MSVVNNDPTRARKRNDDVVFGREARRIANFLQRHQRHAILVRADGAFSVQDEAPVEASADEFVSDQAEDESSSSSSEGAGEQVAN